MTRRVETIVVGAGISGLTFAHARGVSTDLVVLESSERAGGLIRTERAGDVRFELGPEALRFERESELTRLLGELGIEAPQPPANARKRFLVHRGRLLEAPLSPPKLIASPLLSLRGKLRLACEPWRDPKLALDGSVADFVRHRIGAEALAALIDPLVGGIHAGDPEQLSMRACFPRLVQLVEQHGSLFKALRATRGEPAPSVMKPRGGCGVLPDALARALGDKLVLRTAVTALAFDGSRWLARTAGESFEAPQLVLAVPASTAARMLSTVAAPLARALGAIQSESLVSIAHVWPRASVAHALDGFGYLVPSRERLLHLGTLFSSSIDPECCPRDRVVLRTLAGGARNPQLVDWDDAQLLQLVEREVAPLLGLRGAPSFTAIQRWRTTLPRFDLEHIERIAAIRRALPPGLRLLGNYLDGIGVNHLVATAR
jgi:oxygen-dependent protoporphyrinogen oxidase